MSWTLTLGELAQVIGAAPPPAAAPAAFGAVSTDTRKLAGGEVFFALSGENHDGNDFVPAAFAAGAAAAVCGRPMPGGPCLVVDSPLRALQDFAAWHRARRRARVLAITGSCGKTTSKDLIAALLETRHRVVKTLGNLNNDIGCPLSLLQMDESTDYAVIEMGANHMGEIAALCRMARPDESAVTMVAPAHLEGFGSIENVARAKSEIMEGLGPDGVFYVNTDCPWCAAMGARHPGPKVRFGGAGDVRLLSCGFDESGEMVLDIEPVGRLRLPLGVRAHATNVLLALAVALRHGVSDVEGALRGACGKLTRFKAEQIGPLEVLDDSYNANPASMAAALQALADRPRSGVKMAALGEMLELGEAAPALHRELGREAGRLGVARLYARGPHAGETVAGALEAGVPHARAVEDHAEIAASVHRTARRGDTLLVKGSRGMRMEEVTAALRRLYGGD
ncbi:MAG: UDP-N-acetylmuramoyl-tripeptide--D-alanyl-D-alanine ligase [Candidatus Hydrogenedentes bacterium]|nr:UDP-N-acetylmuramoyl-tripeptide--D-alanyl-D-alanine ligase [Candidatus Hydrogenedentota bacterium]